MYKLIDVTLIVVLLVGYFAYGRITIDGSIRSKELPYIVAVYLMAAPYRSLMARNTPLTDLLIDLILLANFLLICFERKLRICINHIIWVFFFMGAAIIYSILEMGIAGIFRIQEVRFHLGIALLITLITTTIQRRGGVQQIAEIFMVNGVLIAAADVISYMIYKQYTVCNILSNRNFVSIYEFIGLIGMLYTYNRKRKKYLIVFAGVIFLDLLLMKSSSVFIGIMVMFVILLLNKIKLSSKSIYRLIAFAVLIAVITTIITIATPEALDNKVVNWVQQWRNKEDNTRTWIWGEAIDIAKEHPLYGIGPDNFRATIDTHKYPTHNDYLKVLVETGILGLVGLVSFIVLSLRDTLKIRDKQVRKYVFSAIIALLTFILFHGYINYVVFWVVLCIPYWWKHIEQREC